MKRFVLPLLLFTLSYLYATTYPTPTNYAVRFDTSGAVGTFEDLEGTVEFDPAKPTEGKFDVSVAVATIKTGNDTKDNHARGDSWFDAENYPRISFVSNRIQAVGDSYEAPGTLTMHGQSKPATIAFTYVDGSLSGSMTVDRKDFGIDGPFLAGGLVGKEVDISLLYESR